MLAGGVWYVASGEGEPDYHAFHASAFLSRCAGPEFVIAIGLLLLVLTPVARVVFSLIGFAAERDWLYVGLTAVVLAILGYSLLAA